VVTSTYENIKEREELQHLRNQAAAIVEFERRMAASGGRQQDSGEWSFLHVVTLRQERIAPTGGMSADMDSRGAAQGSGATA
jgi:hypothetical protein